MILDSWRGRKLVCPSQKTAHEIFLKPVWSSSKDRQFSISALDPIYFIIKYFSIISEIDDRLNPLPRFYSIICMRNDKL